MRILQVPEKEFESLWKLSRTLIYGENFDMNHPAPRQLPDSRRISNVLNAIIVQTNKNEYRRTVGMFSRRERLQFVVSQIYHGFPEEDLAKMRLKKNAEERLWNF